MWRSLPKNPRTCFFFNYTRKSSKISTDTYLVLKSSDSRVRPGYYHHRFKSPEMRQAITQTNDDTLSFGHLILHKVESKRNLFFPGISVCKMPAISFRPRYVNYDLPFQDISGVIINNHARISPASARVIKTIWNIWTCIITQSHQINLHQDVFTWKNLKTTPSRGDFLT